jgi:hypothetical protein
MAELRGNILRDFFGRKTKTRDVSKKTPSRPFNRDATGGLVANGEMLDGLYYGTDPGLQFASPIAFTPIAAPVSLIAIPTPKTEDEQTKEMMNQIIEEKADEFPIIERTKLIKGTSWRWVRYDSRTMKLIWEAIPDESITDVETDPNTDDVMAIYTHDNFKITTAENQVGYVERKRKITPSRVSVQWVRKEGLAKDFQDTSNTNPFGFMPIPFGHDCAEGKWRGNSVYTRILRTLKSGHDIELKRDQILADFNPKLIHEVESVEQFLENNGYGSSVEDCDNDVFESKVFLNLFGKEKTTMLSLPSDATKQHTDALMYKIKMAIIGSGIPELFWGPLATGNAASTETQKDMAVLYIQSLRRENNNPYEKLFNQSMTIMGFINMKPYKPVKMGWDDLDMVSPEVNARIFASVSSGVAQMVTSAGGTKTDLKYFWNQFYPGLPEKTQDEFNQGLTEMAEHKALSNLDAMTMNEVLTAEGDTEETGTGEE